MPPSIGDRLGPYQILAQIGAGGMGIVYRARDTRVDRDVAIKVSGEHFSDRFEREARAVAALNHPNICTLHDVGPDYLVMELVDGEPLKGPLPFPTALDYARQIALALDAAHERGIVHRDLKPANIRVRSDGTVKVLDFGLAKIGTEAEPAADLSNSPTMPAMGTQAGTILGTAAYMAPEQARGKIVDKRADIWAFGVVFYEMLTGRRAFDGDDTSTILGAVLHTEPRLDDVPAGVRRVLQGCLEKDPRKRLRDIGDVWRMLDDAPQIAAPSSRAGRAGWIAAAALAAVAAIALWAPWRTAAPVAPLVRLDVDLGSEIELLRLVAPTFSSLVISPDGTRLVFVASVANGPTRLFLRRMDEATSTELAGTQGASNPFFSPDGQWVAFWGNGKLSKIPVGGGAAIQLAELTTMTGGSWTEDGELMVGTGLPYPTGLFRIPAGGGTPTAVGKLEKGEWFYNFPQVLRDQKIALVSVVGSPPSIAATNVEAISLDGLIRKTLVRGATSPLYLPSGHLLYRNRTGVFAVPFDIEALEVRGTAVPILPDALFDPVTSGAHITMSRNGTLVYRKNTGPSSGPMHVQWIDSAGKREPLLGKPAPYAGRPRISPDGRRVAMAMRDGSNQDIWVYEPERDTMTRLTSGPQQFVSFNPVWTPDGRHVIFGSMGNGVFWTRADGAGLPQLLFAGKTMQFPASVTSDGTRLAFNQIDGRPQLWSVALTQDPSGLKAGTPTQFLETQFDDGEPAFSPDGRWIAYRSDESGRFEVYVRPFSPSPSGNQGRVQISNNGGALPVWMPNGRELLYQASGEIMAVDYTVRDGSLVAGKPRVWAANVSGAAGFDVSPDGKRVAVLLPASASESPRQDHTVVLLQNFLDDLRRRAPAGR